MTTPPLIRPIPLALLVAAGLAVGACGSDHDVSAADGDGPPTIVVRAAASLTEALTRCTAGRDDLRVRLSFGGSDELAAQIRQGAGGDVFAAANTTIPERLAKDGLVERPEPFARNELVLAVPAKRGDVTRLRDLEAGRGTLAIGTSSVPVGSYTRKALGRLPSARRNAILARVRTEEPDVKSVLAKLQQGVVDAAFVYRTDVTATKGAVEAVTLPASIQPTVDYDAAVISDSAKPQAARAFLRDLRHGVCQRALRDSGFLAPEAAG